MLMHFDILKQDEIRKGIAVVLQDMINKELEVKIADKSIVRSLMSLTFPKQIEWLDDRYEIFKSINIKEKITDFLNEQKKFKQSNTMRETLVNNQAVFNKMGVEYADVIIASSLYRGVIEMKGENNVRTNSMEYLLSSFAKTCAEMDDETKDGIFEHIQKLQKNYQELLQKHANFTEDINLKRPIESTSSVTQSFGPLNKKRRSRSNFLTYDQRRLLKLVKYENGKHTVELTKATLIKCLQLINICPNCAENLGANIKLHICDE